MKKSVLLTLFTLLTFSSAVFAVDRTWNFMNWSAATLNNMTADPTNWLADTPTRFSNVLAISAGTTLTANGITISETAGLTFSAFTAAGKLRIDYNLTPSPGRLIMNGNNMTINVPDCATGDTLVVYTKTSSGSSARGITVTNAVRFAGAETSLDSIVNVFTVVADGTVGINNATGIQYRLIAVSAPGNPAVNPISTSISNPTLNAIPVKTVYYNLSGLVAGDSFSSLRRGLYIQKTWYSNGKILITKMVKASE